MKEHTRAWWKKNWADVWFSRFIRERDHGKCYTCGRQKEPKRQQCGHFVPRQYILVRYDEVNCHCQCYICNVYGSGEPSAYSSRLVKDYGKGILEYLESQRLESKEIGHEKIVDFKKIGDEYKLKYEKLLQENSEL